ncbi:ATP synthase subunit epsilon, mitochondrial, partial [Linum perenne]
FTRAQHPCVAATTDCKREKKPTNKGTESEQGIHQSKSYQSPSMALTAAVPFWRSAGMTYISYSNICANLVRNSLKEPFKAEALNREKVHFSVAKWAEGKPQKPTLRSDNPDA